MANTAGSGRHDSNDARVSATRTAKKRSKAINEEKPKATVEAKAGYVSFVFHCYIQLPFGNFDRYANIAAWGWQWNRRWYHTENIQWSGVSVTSKFNKRYHSMCITSASNHYRRYPILRRFSKSYTHLKLLPRPCSQQRNPNYTHHIICFFFCLCFCLFSFAF